jgi:hypothetical protein
MSNSAVVGGCVYGGFPTEVGRAPRSGAQKECAMRGLFQKVTTSALESRNELCVL